MSRSRQREVNVDGALPRNQARGCDRDARASRRTGPSSRDGPRRRAGSRPRAGAPGRTVRIRKRKTTKNTNRATSRSEPVRGSTPWPRAAGRARRAPRRRRRGRRQGLGRDAAAAADGAGRARSGGRVGHVRRATGWPRSARLGVGPPSARGSASAGSCVGVAGRVVLGRRRRRRRRRRVVVVRLARRSLGSTGRPSAPHVAPPARRRSSAVTRAMPPDRITSAGMTNSSDTICATGTPKNVQLSVAQRLEHEPDDAVPDEEDSEEVARAGASARARNPSQIRTISARATPTDRLVQEQRVEAASSRPGTSRAARVRRDPMGAVDRDAPRQGRRRAVQLLVEEVPPAGDGLHRRTGPARRCPPSAGTARACSARTGTPRPSRSRSRRRRRGPE